MRVHALFFASGREAVGKKELEVELSEGSTVAELWKSLTREYPGLEGLSPSLLLAVNQEYVSRDVILKQGDEVAFIPPVSGGING